MRRKGFLERTLHCFLGGIALFEERVSEVLEQLEEKGSRKEKEILAKVSRVRERGMASSLSDALERLAVELNLPTRSEIEEIKSKLDRIEQILREKDAEGEKAD